MLSLFYPVAAYFFLWILLEVVTKKYNCNEDVRKGRFPYIVLGVIVLAVYAFSSGVFSKERHNDRLGSVKLGTIDRTYVEDKSELIVEEGLEIQKESQENLNDFRENFFGKDEDNG